MSNTLTEMLGVLVGFCGIMLILSLIVTSLVQLTQAIFRFRARNLKYGLFLLFSNTLSPALKIKAKKFAEDLIQLSDPTILQAKNIDRSPLKKLLSRIIGSKVTWIPIEELPRQIAKLDAGLSQTEIDELKEGFDELDPYLKRRFSETMRLVTISWAVGIAVLFQINGLDLLSKLSTDPKLRATYVQFAEQQEDPTKKIHPMQALANVTQLTLAEFAEKHPELQSSLEPIIQISQENKDVSRNVLLVLSSLAQEEKTVLTAEYLGLLTKNSQLAVDGARAVVADLSQINIKLWAEGDAFFVNDNGLELDNIIGVIFTAILLTMGAPFWFEQLQRLVSFRDALKRGTVSTKTTDSK